MHVNDPNDESERREIAEIIFQRVAAQISGTSISHEHWNVAYAECMKNPAAFPLVEACIDAADAILSRHDQ